MRNNPTNVPPPTPTHQILLMQLKLAQAMGEEMNSATTVIDKTIEVVRCAITAMCYGIDAGLACELTQEDQQRVHELKALLDDLPK